MKPCMTAAMLCLALFHRMDNSLGKLEFITDFPNSMNKRRIVRVRFYLIP